MVKITKKFNYCFLRYRKDVTKHPEISGIAVFNAKNIHIEFMKDYLDLEVCKKFKKIVEEVNGELVGITGYKPVYPGTKEYHNHLRKNYVREILFDSELKSKTATTVEDLVKKVLSKIKS